MQFCQFQLRAKRFQRPLSWRSLSLSRKDTLKSDSRRSKGALFRSPSIYEEDKEEEEGDVMASYLAEKICPLTPSQKPTNISHLVQRNQQLSPPQVRHVQCFYVCPKCYRNLNNKTILCLYFYSDNLGNQPSIGESGSRLDIRR